MKIISVFFLLLILIFPGCSDDKAKDENLSKTGKDLSVGVITETELKEIINNRNNKLLFINVWATWCVPCVEEFPDLVKLYEEYENDVDFLSLSADFVSEIDSKIIPFLKEQKAEFPVYIIKEDRSEQVIRLLSDEWNGALPATFIYDGDGNQQKFFMGLQTFSGLKSSIDSLHSL